MTVDQKKQALTNVLRNWDLPQKYFIVVADRPMCHQFAIATPSELGGIHYHTNFMTYDEMNAFFIGYKKALNNPFKP